MKITTTELDGVLIIEPKVHSDGRGSFYESYVKQKYIEHGILDEFIQDNHSISKKGVLRGLHFQEDPEQAKLVRVTHGEVFDVAVDIRQGSPTFGKWIGIQLSEENHLQMYIPGGFAHGFCVLSDTAEFLYKCSAYYAPSGERAVLWNDPDIGIDWPIKNPILSEKDTAAPRLRDL
jgi:dTDP-4-dehydrorhamnose 3,5-epimerase